MSYDIYGNPAHCESAHYLGRAQEEIARLKDEVQALRKDAARYHFLRNTDHLAGGAILDMYESDIGGDDLDSAVVAAMEKQK